MIVEKVSATQVDSAKLCPRKWWLHYVQKIPIPKTQAFETGSLVHEVFEGFVRDGTLKPEHSEWHSVVKTARDYLPAVADPEIELAIEMPTFEGGPKWVGFIDFYYPQTHPPKVVDIKTLSNFRYCKTPAELLLNTQLCAYAHWAMGKLNRPLVEIEHIYIRTKTPHITQSVAARATSEAIAAQWISDLEVVKQIVELGKLEKLEEVEPNTGSCGAYGGCAFRSNCGLGVKSFSFLKTEQKTMAGLSLSEKLAAKRAAQGNPEEIKVETLSTNQETIKVEEPQPVIQSVLPPDVPNRDEKPIVELVEAKTEIVETSKRRGRPAKTQESVSEVPPKEKAEPVVAKDKFALEAIYIDCLPIKGPHKQSAVMFEDFIAPLAQETAESMGLADYRLADFGKGKIALACTVMDNLNKVPPVLIVSSYSPGTAEILGILLPRANTVVKALKG